MTHSSLFCHWMDDKGIGWQHSIDMDWLCYHGDLARPLTSLLRSRVRDTSRLQVYHGEHWSSSVSILPWSKSWSGLHTLSISLDGGTFARYSMSHFIEVKIPNHPIDHFTNFLEIEPLAHLPLLSTLSIYLRRAIARAPCVSLVILPPLLSLASLHVTASPTTTDACVVMQSTPLLTHLRLGYLRLHRHVNDTWNAPLLSHVYMIQPACRDLDMSTLLINAARSLTSLIVIDMSPQSVDIISHHCINLTRLYITSTAYVTPFASAADLFNLEAISRVTSLRDLAILQSKNMETTKSVTCQQWLMLSRLTNLQRLTAYWGASTFLSPRLAIEIEVQVYPLVCRLASLPSVPSWVVSGVSISSGRGSLQYINGDEVSIWMYQHNRGKQGRDIRRARECHMVQLLYDNQHDNGGRGGTTVRVNDFVQVRSTKAQLRRICDRYSKYQQDMLLQQQYGAWHTPHHDDDDDCGGSAKKEEEKENDDILYQTNSIRRNQY
jgi:hypothetical protein